MTASDVERGLRERLDNWRLWMGVAYFGLVAIVIFGFVLSSRVGHETAKRTAEQRANNVADLKGCYDGADTGPDLLALIEAIRLNAANTLKTSRAALAVDPHGPLAEIRRASIRRSAAAIASSGRFRARILKATPSLEECDALAHRLGLQPRGGAVPE